MAETEKLISMIKDDVVLKIHPTCVKAHEEVGWKVVPTGKEVPAEKEKTPETAPKADRKTAGAHARGAGADTPTGEVGAGTPEK